MFNTEKTRRRTVRFFALSSAFNGVLAVVLGTVIFIIVGGEEKATLGGVLEKYSIDPAHFIPPLLEPMLPAVENVHPFIIAVAAFLYALLRFLETYGLWIDAKWGEAFCALSAVLYIPFEVDSILKDPNWLNISALVFNLAVIFFMTRLLLMKKT